MKVAVGGTPRARASGRHTACASCSASASSDAPAPASAPAPLSRRELARIGLCVGAASIAPLELARPGAALADAAALPLVPAGTSLSAAPDFYSTAVIKGCWQLSGGHRGDPATDRTSKLDAVNDFAKFVEAGVTSFDTGPVACGYGPSERIIGDYMEMRAKSEMPRDKVQIFSKLCCVGQEQRSMTLDFVRDAVNTSIFRTNAQYLDLVQMYWNDYSAKGYIDAGLYLMDLKASGKVKNIALTNFDTARMAEICDAGVEVATNQIQYSLLDRRPEREMARFCKERGVGLLPYGVLGGGLLTQAALGVRADGVRMDTFSKQKYASVLRRVGSWEWLQNLLQTLARIAAKHDTTVANISTRWVLEKEEVPAVIVGARNTSHLADHRALFTFALDEKDYAEINTALGASGGRAPEGEPYQWERGLGPF
mmetsp:Transcript_15856/g.51956  ORF Transcript_15856/g.51956 Transcript_15856/m.51956 type:complete len:426 (+) Transcript_15856:756-2033(+)